MKPSHLQITSDRALQIVNNVAEEFNDDADTSFATKAELCATILWLREDQDKELRRKDEALDEIFMTAAKARLYKYLP